MPTTRKAEKVEELEEVEETNGKRPYVPRLSLTMTSEMMKNIRIASALADMRPGEWCSSILERAADKVIEDMKG
jgi:serine kinase of HPr protein (carbohydrate metabolism regulator)